MGNVRYKPTIITYPINMDLINYHPDYTCDVLNGHNLDIKPNIDYNYYLFDLAKSLHITYEDLFTIIAYETMGTFDPKALNKSSGARGLIQFNDIAASCILDKQGNHLKSANALINEYPTIKDQLAIPNKVNRIGGPVYQYLKKHGPYKNSEDLFLAVFYPVARDWNRNKLLPANIRRSNPGLNKVSDYYNMAKSRVKLTKQINPD